MRVALCGVRVVFKIIVLCVLYCVLCVIWLSDPTRRKFLGGWGRLSRIFGSAGPQQHFIHIDEDFDQKFGLPVSALQHFG